MPQLRRVIYELDLGERLGCSGTGWVPGRWRREAPGLDFSDGPEPIFGLAHRTAAYGRQDHHRRPPDERLRKPGQRGTPAPPRQRRRVTRARTERADLRQSNGCLDSPCAWALKPGNAVPSGPRPRAGRNGVKYVRRNLSPSLCPQRCKAGVLEVRTPVEPLPAQCLVPGKISAWASLQWVTRCQGRGIMPSSWWMPPLRVTASVKSPWWFPALARNLRQCAQRSRWC